MKKNIKKILSVVLVIAMVGVIFMGCDTESVKSTAQKTSQDTKNAISAGANIIENQPAPTGKALWNNWFYNVQKADDDTNYKTRKKVEDTCRAMMSSYETDKLTYEQYINSDNDEKKSWAEQAKMRANKTASTYNNYILENSFVWEDNIPSDINYKLEYIE